MANAIYIVKELSYIDGRLVLPGEQVRFDHDPGYNLEPFNDEAKERFAATPQRKGPNDAGFMSDMLQATNAGTVAQGVGTIPAQDMPLSQQHVAVIAGIAAQATADAIAKLANPAAVDPLPPAPEQSETDSKPAARK